MTIYTVIKEEMLEFIPSCEALMSFETREAAISYLQGQIEDIKQFWKHRERINYEKDMEADESTPHYFAIWENFSYAANHTALSISENKLIESEKNDIVTIHCYGNTERLPRQKAIMKYFAGMCNCDGSERDRYTNIYAALMNGEKECYD